MKKNMAKFKLALLGVAAILSLSACDMNAPSKLSYSKPEVVREVFSDDVLLSEVTDAYLSRAASYYLKKGEAGTFSLAVTFDPHHGANTAMIAGENASRYAAVLHEMGVKDLRAQVLPVNGQGAQSHLLLTFDYYLAQMPSDCSLMAGMEADREIIADEAYKLGCSIDAVMAQQVSNPRDLLGRKNTDAQTDGRSAANIVENVRSGTQNKKLDGLNSTEN